MHCTRKWRIVGGLAVAAAIAIAPRPARAQERSDSDSPAMTANRGLNIDLAPMVLLPFHASGPYGGGLELHGRYGFDVGPTILAPGGLVGGYLISERFIGLAMPTLRWTLPIGPLAPYVLGGVGGGWLSNPSEAGLAWLGGGGLMVHFGRVVAVGAELTYRTITDTEYGGLVFGPAISFGG